MPAAEKRSQKVLVYHANHFCIFHKFSVYTRPFSPHVRDEILVTANNLRTDADNVLSQEAFYKLAKSSGGIRGRNIRLPDILLHTTLHKYHFRYTERGNDSLKP